MEQNETDCNAMEQNGMECMYLFIHIFDQRLLLYTNFKVVGWNRIAWNGTEQNEMRRDEMEWMRVPKFCYKVAKSKVPSTSHHWELI